MTESATRTPVAKNWADEIDDLHFDATQRRLQAVFLTRNRDRLGSAGSIGERMPTGESRQRGAPTGDIAR